LTGFLGVFLAIFLASSLISSLSKCFAHRATANSSCDAP
jgi:hypothetical protein